MNKVYSLVWNRSRKQIEVASELARSRGDGVSGAASAGPLRRMLVVAVLASFGLALGAPAHADYAAGSGVISTSTPCTNDTNFPAVGSGTGVAISAGAGSPASACTYGAVAIGSKAVAATTAAVAIGHGAYANSGEGVAIGSDAVVKQYLVRSGYYGGRWGVAIGHSAYAAGNGSDVANHMASAMALGGDARALADGSIALGEGARAGTAGSATDYYDTAIGAYAEAAGAGAVSVGGGALASGDGAIAIGGVTSTGQAAFGGNASATSPFAIAIGSSANAGQVNAVALGLDAIASNANDVALGAGSATLVPSSGPYSINGGTIAATVDRNGVVSVGSAGNERQIQNVAAGTISETSTDAVNGSQLYAVGTQVNTNTANIANLQADQVHFFSADGVSTDANYNNDGATGVNALAAGVNAGAAGAGATAVGNGSQASGTSAVAIGQNANATNTGSAYSTVVGSGNVNYTYVSPVDGTTYTGASLAGEYSNAFGWGAQAFNRGDTAVGTYAHAGASTVGTSVETYDTALGYMTHAIGGVSLAIGAFNQAIGQASIAIGYGATANGAGDVALGAGSITAPAVATPSGTINGTQYTYAGGAPDAVVSIGGGVNPVTNATVTRQITNLAAGQVTSASTDAVNGSQLYATNQAIDAVGAVANAGWNLSANGGTGVNVKPGTTVDVAQGTNIVVTQDATTGDLTIATSDTPVFTSVTAGNSVLGTNGLTVNDGNNSTTYGAVGMVIAGGPSVTAGGIDAGGLRITSVADGSVANNSTDAVNGSQLYAVQQTVNAGWNVTTAAAGTGVANGASVANVGPGQTLTLTAGDNIVATQNGTDVAIGLNPVLTGLTSVTTGNTLMDSNGVTITGGANGTVSLTDAGLDNGGNQIHGVAAGTASTDAVNVSQLDTAVAGAKTHYYSINDGGTLGANYDNDGATGVDAMAAGVGALASGALGTAIGTSSRASGLGATAVGALATAGDHATALGLQALAATAGTALGYYSTANVHGTAVGEHANAYAAATAIGSGANASGYASFAGGQNASAPGYAATAVGNGAAASGDGSVALGTTTVASGTYATAVGPFAVAQGYSSAALGDNANALGDRSLALGANAMANNADDVALGDGSVTAAANPTATGVINGVNYAYAGGSPASVVSVGSAGNERQITNVAAGRVSATSTDAVNGSQLYATNQAIGGMQQQINNINQGGNGQFQTSADSTGSPAPTGKNSAAGGANATASGTNSVAVGNDSTASGDQGTAVGTSATASGVGSTALGDGAQATGDNSVALGAGSVASGDNTVSVGSSGHERKITNVAAGTAGTDAVNVSQLQAAQQGGVQYDSNPDGTTDYNSVTLNPGGTGPTVIHNVATGVGNNDAVNVGQLNTAIAGAVSTANNYTDQRYNELKGSMTQIGNRANAGIASAIAAASLPQPYAPNQSSLGVGLGSFRGEAGIAVGLSKITESGRFILKANVSSDTRGDVGAGVGAGIVW